MIRHFGETLRPIGIGPTTLSGSTGATRTRLFATIGAVASLSHSFFRNVAGYCHRVIRVWDGDLGNCPHAA